MTDKSFNSPEEAAFAMRAATGVQLSDEPKVGYLKVDPYNQTIQDCKDNCDDQDLLPPR